MWPPESKDDYNNRNYLLVIRPFFFNGFGLQPFGDSKISRLKIIPLK